MNTHSWLLIAAAMAPLALAACKVTTTDPTGSGGEASTTTAETTATSATSTSTTTSGTGGSGGGVCTGIFPGPACSTCGEASCCAEGAACDATPGCIACVYSTDPACTAANKAAADELVTCMHAFCESSCFPPPPTDVDVTCSVPAPIPGTVQGACISVGGDIECNPVTNEFCDSAKGEACDFEGKGYHCYPGQNVRALCETCGPTSAAGQCKPGSTCLPGPEGKCGKFCCSSAECGAGKCDKSAALPGGVGYCIGGNP